MDIVESTKNRLATALAVRNMKPIDLSNKTGISKSSISQYLSGRSTPKQDRIYLFAKALMVSPAWLIGYDVPMELINNSDYVIMDGFGDKVSEIIDLMEGMDDRNLDRLLAYAQALKDTTEK